jgi:hypothetical protein
MKKLSKIKKLVQYKTKNFEKIIGLITLPFMAGRRESQNLGL